MVNNVKRYKKEKKIDKNEPSKFLSSGFHIQMKWQ